MKYARYLGLFLCLLVFVMTCGDDDDSSPVQPYDPEVSPTSFNFGNVCIGQSKDGSFTIKNTGNGTLTGTVSVDCDDYSIVSGGGSYSLGAGQSRTVTVRFTPTSTGTNPCAIEIGSGSNLNVSYTGDGIDCADCEVSPISFNFGTVCIGQSVEETFTITNNSGDTLTGTVSVSSDDYSIVAGGGSYSLETGQSLTVTVQFAPTSAGTKTCTIETGTSCSYVSCNGLVNCQGAELHFYNFRKSGDYVIADVVSTILDWDISEISLVIYDADDSKTANDCAVSGYTSLQIWQDQLFASENWIYPKYESYNGLPISSECADVDMLMTGRLEGSPDSDEGWFSKTDRNNWSMHYSISTSCETANHKIDEHYFNSAPTATRFYYWFVEPGNWNDGWIAEMKLTFNDWWIFIPEASATQKGTVKIISAKDKPELWPKNWKPRPKAIIEQ